MDSPWYLLQVSFAYGIDKGTLYYLWQLDLTEFVPKFYENNNNNNENMVPSFSWLQKAAKYAFDK